MNIALIGHGTMGHEVEKEAERSDHTVCSVITNTRDLKNTDLQNVDVAIEMSRPEAVVSNIEILAKKEVTTVVGTTGWYSEMAQVRKLVENTHIGFLWSSNFSLGVQLFLKIVEQGARYIDRVPEYDVFVHEFHHKNKKDSPSGTAHEIAKRVLRAVERKDKMVSAKLNRMPAPGELHVSSTRGGSVPGTHSVFFDRFADTIEITHRARNRTGFAIGAVRAAEWLKGKRGFYEMSDFINDIFSK